MRTARVWFEDLTALCEGLERLRVAGPAAAGRAVVAEQVSEPVPAMIEDVSQAT
jgi:hypothetical protein